MNCGLKRPHDNRKGSKYYTGPSQNKIGKTRMPDPLISPWYLTPLDLWSERATTFSFSTPPASPDPSRFALPSLQAGYSR